MKKIRLALTKGRLEKHILQRLEEGGCDVSTIVNRGRKLIVDAGEFEVVFAKANDVVTFVEHGVCDLGVVGKDTLLEMEADVFEIKDMNFGKCKFCVATKKGVDIFDCKNKKVIATKYPLVCRNYFDKKNMDIEIIKIEGSVELAPLLNLADAIVDIVETGTTLKENGLHVVDEICDISARLICNYASLKMHKEEIYHLAEKL